MRRSRRDLTVVAAHDQVAFPVTWNSAILDRGRSLSDRYRVGDPAVVLCLLCVVTRTTHRTRLAKMLNKLFFKGPAGLDEEALVDRLVRHVEVLFVWIRVF